MNRFFRRHLSIILLGSVLSAAPLGSLLAAESIDIDLGGGAAKTSATTPTAKPGSVPAKTVKPAGSVKATKPTNGKAVLSEITVVPDGGETRVEITGTHLLEPKLIRLSNRYVLDFTKSTLTATKPTGAGLVERIRTGSPSPGTVRVVAEAPLAKDARVEALENGFVLVLTGDQKTAPAGQSSARKAEDAAREVPAAKADKTADAKVSNKASIEKSIFNRLINLSFKQTETGMKVVLTADGPVKYTVRKLARPEKLVIRLHGTKLDVKERVMNIKKGEPALEKGGLLAIESREIGSRLAPISEIILTLQPRTIHQIAQDINQVVITLNAPMEVKAVEKAGNMNQTVSVDLEGADLNTVLKTLGAEAGFDVDLLTGVGGSVHQRLKEVSFKQALAILLAPGGYHYEVQGNTLRIGTANDLKNTKKVMPQVMEILYPGNLTPQGLDSLVQSVLPPTNGVQPVIDPNRNALILKGTPADIEQYKKTIRDLKLDSADSDRITRIVKLNYAEPSNISGILTAYLTPQGHIQLDDRNKSLVIWEAASNMGVLLELIKELDIRLPQVLIESSIVEVSTENNTKLGLTWTTNKTTGDPTLSTNAFLQPTDFAGSLIFGTVRGGFNINATLRALEENKAGKVISRPRVATASGVAASIQTTENVIYTSTTQTIVDNNILTQTTYMTLALPISLNVTPRITEDGRITTVVVANIVSVAGPAVGNAPPPTTQQTAQTTITVKNGDTIVIGGLVRDIMQEQVRKIPLLGSLPILGTLFRSKENSHRKAELIIFITPTLLED